MTGDEGQVLYLWELATSGAPEDDRLGWLAARTEIPFRELDWARRIRNRIAHPDGARLDSDDVSRAAEILSDALDRLDDEDIAGAYAGDEIDPSRPDPAASRQPAYDVDPPADWSRGLLSKAEPVVDRLAAARGPLQVAVPIVVGLTVLWIAVDIVGGLSKLDQPLTYVWLVLVLALIALAVVYVAAILGFLLIGTLILGLVSGSWMPFLQVCLGIAVVGVIRGLLLWLYDL